MCRCGDMDKQEESAKVAEEVKKCRKCGLWRGAIQSVPGEGSFDAKVIFVGEAPGFHEDQRGIPFCGAAGKLLDKLLTSIRLKRDEVFITNVLKHRPPGNRDPSPEEIEACRSFLDRQIEIIEPEIIVTLGRFSMAKFLPNALISQVHGQPRFVQWGERELIVIPMYHPAAALRNGKIMMAEQEDFIKLGKFLEKLNGGEEVEVEKEKEKEEQLKLI